MILKRLVKNYLARLWPPGRDNRVILVYHSIGGGSPHSQSPESFAAQMRWLKANCRVAPLEQMLDPSLWPGERLAAITFDDGYRDNYVYAYPVLRALELPFTIFPATGFLEQRSGFYDWSPHYRGLPPLAWDQVREMQEAGATIGSHTHLHRRLSACSSAEIREELETSKAILERRLHRRITLFAYPFGQPHDYDRRAVKLAAQAGYAAAFTTLQRSFASVENRFEAPRVTVSCADTLEEFQQKVSGRRNYMALIEQWNSALVRRGWKDLPVGGPAAACWDDCETGRCCRCDPGRHGVTS